MIKIKIEGPEELHQSLSDIEKRQMPFATAVAITRTAKEIERGLQEEMAATFKPVSPYVRRSTFSTSANKSALEATIGLKDFQSGGGMAPAELLKEHFTGGRRGSKPFEKSLIKMGAMPNGFKAMPGKGMKLDSYGNPNRRAISEMLGALRARMQVYKGKGKKLALVGYFVVPLDAKSHLYPGVYKRVNRAGLHTLFVFVPVASYNKVIDFQKTAGRVVDNRFKVNFADAFADAIRTAI